jgi:hypothetical protein
MRITALLLTGASLLAACGSEDGTPAKASPSADLASRVVQEDELLGFTVVADVANQVRTEPGAFTADSRGLYGNPEELPGLRRDGFVAGIVKRFEKPREDGAAESVAVQMRDDKGAAAEAKRQYAFPFLPCPEDPDCAKATDRFEVPGIPGAMGVRKVLKHRPPLDDVTITFSKGVFAYSVTAGGAEPFRTPEELIAVARTLYDRVPEAAD